MIITFIYYYQQLPFDVTIALAMVTLMLSQCKIDVPILMLVLALFDANELIQNPLLPRIIILWLHHITLAYEVIVSIVHPRCLHPLYLPNLYYSHCWISVIGQAVLHCWKTTTNFKICWSTKLFLINLDGVHH